MNLKTVRYKHYCSNTVSDTKDKNIDRLCCPLQIPVKGNSKRKSTSRHCFEAIREAFTALGAPAHAELHCTLHSAHSTLHHSVAADADRCRKKWTVTRLPVDGCSKFPNRQFTIPAAGRCGAVRDTIRCLAGWMDLVLWTDLR